MRLTRLKQFFCQGPYLKIKIGENSELKRYLRNKKTLAELSWQRKMRQEWTMILFTAIVCFNTMYNSFPEIWLSHNLFMHSDHSLVVEAKK